MPRRAQIASILAIATLMTIVLTGGLRSGMIVPGWAGEWTWDILEPEERPLAGDLIVAVCGLAVFAGWAALGYRRLSVASRLTRAGQAFWVSTLLPMGLLVQLALLWGAPAGYGLAKWSSLWMAGSSGYFSVAEKEMDDTARFLRDYPAWIRGQGVLHIGTHPPGLFLLSKGILTLTGDHPRVGEAIDRFVPKGMKRDLQAILGPLPTKSRAAIALAGGGTLITGVLTVLPLYALVRGAGGSASTAWAAAALWPVVPSAILFHPTSDTLYPVLSTLAMALAVRGRGVGAFLSGLVLGLGMLFSLVFLAVGLIVAMLLIAGSKDEAGWWKRAIALLLWTGLGFGLICLSWWLATGANPFLIWWWNQRNHSGFYGEYPRTYLVWILINPVELLVALGIASAVWALVGLLTRGRGAWPAVCVLVVLVVLTLSGRSLSEVARLWLPLLPGLLCASGAGLDRLGAGGGALAVSVCLVGLEVLALQSTLQVVYPV